MTEANFERILSHVLKHEGGWANHPNDPGGATMKGVIQRVYDGYRDRKSRGRRSVRHIEQDELLDIYRAQYWQPVRGDDLPDGIDLCVFDAAVNSGPTQAARWLQRALGVPADGHIGEGTLTACLQHGDHVVIINSMCDQRIAFMKDLRNKNTGKPLWPDFGKGWSRRVADVRSQSNALARKVIGEEPDDVLAQDSEAPEPDHAGGKALPPPVEQKAPTKSKTLWSTLGQILAAAGAFIGTAFSNPYVIAACVILIIFFALFIGRERLRKLAEDAI